MKKRDLKDEMEMQEMVLASLSRDLHELKGENADLVETSITLEGELEERVEEVEDLKQDLNGYIDTHHSQTQEIVELERKAKHYKEEAETYLVQREQLETDLFNAIADTISPEDLQAEIDRAEGFKAQRGALVDERDRLYEETYNLKEAVIKMALEK